MGKLILNPDFKLYERDGQAFCSSRQVAEEFNREHKDVLENIRNAIDTSKNLDAEFSAANFWKSEFKIKGRYYPEYLLTKDGFSFVVMGFTGEKAARFKIEYIKRFNDMEAFIKSLLATKIEFPVFTDAIMEAHEEPKHYHFSNEINMIYRVVLGMDAKKFREAKGIKKGAVIKPYLSLDQIRAVEYLQRVDIGLIVAIPDYQERKKTLAQYYAQLLDRKKIA